MRGGGACLDMEIRATVEVEATTESLQRILTGTGNGGGGVGAWPTFDMEYGV